MKKVVILGVSLLCVVLADIVPGADSAQGISSVAVSEQKPGPEPYCGVRSLYAAMRALGKQVAFSDLLEPQYIDSRQGSSIVALIHAASDQGLYTKHLSRMTCSGLREMTLPCILHVRKDLGNPEFRHWLLFLGTQDGKARIFDDIGPVTTVGFDELSAEWDGHALVVSTAPISLVSFYTVTFLWFGFYAALVLLIVAFIYAHQRFFRFDWLWPIQRIRRVVGKTLSATAVQMVCVLGVAVIVGYAWRTFTYEGFLSCGKAIQAVQDRHLVLFLPKMKQDELIHVQNEGNVTVVDARTEREFESEHVNGAINIPAGCSSQVCQDRIKAIPQLNRVVVYGNTRCPVTRALCQKFLSLGYQNLFLLDGWNKTVNVLEKSGR